MNKINAEHLARRACVYVRQSTPGQVQNNLESQRRQYALVDHARALGWQDVEVIDDDLGISGSGTPRPGFERLLRELCNGRVGAVFSVEASRLARNGRDWHTLLEFCSVVDALLIIRLQRPHRKLGSSELVSAIAHSKSCASTSASVEFRI